MLLAVDAECCYLMLLMNVVAIAAATDAATEYCC
jgi:hypothetical protein